MNKPTIVAVVIGALMTVAIAMAFFLRAQPKMLGFTAVSDHGVSFSYPANVTYRVHEGATTSHYNVHTITSASPSNITILIPVAEAPGETAPLSERFKDYPQGYTGPLPRLEVIRIDGREAERMVTIQRDMKPFWTSTSIQLPSAYPDTRIVLNYQRFPEDSSLDEAWNGILQTLRVDDRVYTSSLPKTNLDTTYALGDSDVRIRYPSEGFYSLGANVIELPTKGAIISGVHIETTAPFDPARISEFVTLDAGVSRTDVNSLDAFVDAIPRDNIAGSYVDLNGHYVLINGHDYFLYRVTEDVTVWRAFTWNEGRIINMSLAYKPGDDPEAIEAYKHNDDLFMKLLSHIEYGSEDLASGPVRYNCNLSSGVFKDGRCICPLETNLGQTQETQYDKNTGFCQSTTGGPIGDAFNASIGLPLTRAATGSARLYVKIHAVRPNSDMDLQLVDFVATDDAAEQAALEENVCSLQRIENDECTPNGFFLRTTNKTLTLQMSPEVRIETYDWTNPQGPTLQPVSREDFIQNAQIKYHTETSPFIITTTNGHVTEIQEQYIP